MKKNLKEVFYANKTIRKNIYMGFYGSFYFGFIFSLFH